MESILISIKKLLGLTDNYTAFDADILTHINSAFSVLAQLGVGPETGFVAAENSLWTDFDLGEEADLLEMVKTYIYLKVRVVFDPPTNSFVVDAFNKQIAELEWRMNVVVDKYPASVNSAVEDG